MSIVCQNSCEGKTFEIKKAELHENLMNEGVSVRTHVHPMFGPETVGMSTLEKVEVNGIQCGIQFYDMNWCGYVFPDDRFDGISQENDAFEVGFSTTWGFDCGHIFDATYEFAEKKITTRDGATFKTRAYALDMLHSITQTLNTLAGV